MAHACFILQSVRTLLVVGGDGTMVWRMRLARTIQSRLSAWVVGLRGGDGVAQWTKRVQRVANHVHVRRGNSAYEGSQKSAQPRKCEIIAINSFTAYSCFVLLSLLSVSRLIERIPHSRMLYRCTRTVPPFMLLTVLFSKVE